jgi:hypothetical protein
MPLSSTDNAKCHLLFAARRRCWRTPFSKNQGFVAQIVRAAMVCESVTQSRISGLILKTGRPPLASLRLQRADRTVAVALIDLAESRP